MNFNELQFEQDFNVKRAALFFPNWYGISIIRWQGTYGAEEWLYEIAVLKGTEKQCGLCYDTPITDDVIWYLSEEQVLDYITQVEALPPVN